MFNNFFGKINDFKNKVEEIELNVYGSRKRFLEIFERNLKLEQEIDERTQELNQANKSILTLQQIWKTMNSKEPLSEVLNTVIKGLIEDLGYSHAFVFQLMEEDNDKYIKFRAVAPHENDKKIRHILNNSIENYKISYDCDDNIAVKAMKTKTVYHVTQSKDIYEGSYPEITEEQRHEMSKVFLSRSATAIPIFAGENPFGCLMVFSIRRESSDTEQSFLQLLGQQIEVAVTIAGLFETIRKQAITDPMTGLYNRRHFEEHLMREVERAERLKQPFSLISLDLDHLKYINDTFGHSVGDVAICTIADVLHKNARSIDIPARFGGEEFGILLPGIDSESAFKAAERLREAIETSPIEHVEKVTASIGVATFLEHTNNVDELLELVDQAMYRAKNSGRNQVKMATKNNDKHWKELAINAFIDLLSKQKMPINKNTVKELVSKLNENVENANTSSDLLYFVVDSLSKTYNPMAQTGLSKEKLLMASKLAKNLELSKEEVDKIKLASLLYDVGNILMPKEILQKPGPLNEKEKAQIAQHPLLATKELLEPISDLKDIIPVIEHHHENWDGSGYPNQISGEEIPIGSRIILIIDAYFALISERPYRPAHTKKEAIGILKKEVGKKWDKTLFLEFLKIVND